MLIIPEWMDFTKVESLETQVGTLEANLADVPVTVTYTGLTDASGNYTVVYPTPHTNVPDVQVRVQAGSFNQLVRVVDTSTTGFTVEVANRDTAVITGLEVLLSSTTPVVGASVSLIVTEVK